MMDPKKTRKIPRKIEITSDTPVQFGLGDTSADISSSVSTSSLSQSVSVDKQMLNQFS